MATDHPLERHSLPVIDAASLTQSELLSLSRCTHSVLDQRDVLIPEIDRSIFNESVATRRQTYSEIRLCNRRKRRSKTSAVREVRFESGDSELDQNRLIVRLLKDMIKTSPLHDPAGEERMKCDDEKTVDREGGGGDVRRRKRGRKVETMAVVEEIVNRNGAVVDLAVLENVLDPYGEELKRRTAGMVSEEDFLGFLKGLDGEWGSRRRKSRRVDACELGDHLPVRWKLLLALRRSEGRIWLYCRRYISPGGQEYVSCKDVALYLKSLFGVSNDQLIDVNMDNIHNYAGTLFEEDNLGNGNFPVAAAHKSSVYDEQGRGVALERIEKLVDVQVSSLFECHQCKLVFHEKKFYLQHVLSCHEKTTKRYRLGSRVRNGVILDNGQYECQFCFSIFQEKDSCGSHDGVHIRGCNNESLDRTCADVNAELITLSNRSIRSFSGKRDGSSMMLPNPCLDTFTTADNNEFHGSLTLIKLNVPSSDGNSCYKLVSDSLAAPEVSGDEIPNHVPENQDIEKGHWSQLKFKGNNNLVSDIYSDNSRIARPIDNMISLADDFTQPADQLSEVLDDSRIACPSDKYDKCACENVSPACAADSEHSISVGKEVNYKEGSLKFSVQTVTELETTTDTHMKQNIEQNVMTSGLIVSSRDFGEMGSVVQPSDHFTDFSSIPCEGEDLSSLRQKLESVADFELDCNVQTVYELKTATGAHMKQNLQNVMISGEIVSSGDFGKSGSMLQLSDHRAESCYAPCEGEDLSSFRQKLEKVAEFELKNTVQTVNELDKNIDTHMKENPERNVMACGEIMLSRDIGKSLSMVQPSDHLVSSILCEGEDLSSLGQKLETAGEFGSEYSVQPIHEFETNTDTHMKQNLERVMASGEIVLSEDIGKSGLMVQPCEGEELSSFTQKSESAAEFEELKLDDIETPISLPIREESLPLSVVSMDIEKDVEVNNFDANRVEVEGILGSMECRLQVTAVCVWCNSEFIYEVVNSELLADSVGYMCTTCRAKITAQFNASTMVYP